MADGFKLLDAYVEVKADATGIGEKVSKAFAGEIAPAAKKMADAVESATTRVAAATKRQEDAAASLKLAQMRLADVQKTAAEGSTQLVSAQERVAAAMRNVNAAAASAERAQKSLAGAQSQLQEAGAKGGSGFLSGLGGMIGAGAIGGGVAGIVSGLVSTVAGGVTSVISGTISNIDGMLVTVGKDIASTVISFNSQLQNANIGFTTMLGSGKKAQSFLNDLQKFAQTTPFEFGNLVHNAQSMMGMGIAAKAVIPDLTALGDSVAAMGGSASQVDSVVLAFDQMNAKGTLDMGNMNQLMENGVPSALKVMAAAYHTTTGKMINMISTGKVQADVALPALVKGIEKGTKATASLGGMMDKQSSTFTGALSNIQDGFTQTVSKALKPFFDAASKGMLVVANAFNGKPVKEFSKTVTSLIQPLASSIGKWFSHLNLAPIFTTASKALGAIGKAIRQVFMDPGVQKSIGGLGKSIGNAFGHIGPTLAKMLPDAVRFAKTVLPAIIDAVKGVVDHVPAMLDLFRKIGKFLADNGPAIGGFVTGIGNIVSAMMDLSAKVDNGILDIESKFNGMRNWMGGFFAGLTGWFKDVGVNLIQGLVGGLTGAAGFLTDAINKVIGGIPDIAKKLLGIASPSKVFHLIGTQVGQGLHLGLLGSVDQIKVASQKMIDAVMGKGGWAGTTLGSRMVAAIKRDAKDLERLSGRRAAATARLATDRGNLSTVLGNRSSFAANVSSSLMGGADVAGLFSAQPTSMSAPAGTLNGKAYQGSWTSSGPSGLGNVKASLQGLLRDEKTFASNLQRLVKLHIDPATYDQLVQAGVSGGGLTTSTALLNDPAMARSIFSLEGQIGKAGASLGAQTAGHEYASQVAAARAAIARDQRTINNINLTMVVEAKKIDEVQKLLRMVSGLRQTARKG